MLWLHEQKLVVHGVELYEHAVESFFSENKLSPFEKKQQQDFLRFIYQDITIDSGDFFKLKENEAYDFVYDRAALVALPVEMRKTYAELITKSLKPGGKCLLIVYEYDQAQMEGPPFSVDDLEIQHLYGDRFEIKLMVSKALAGESSRLASVVSLKQKVYILEKLR
jgi:thiopurine S-methyltransferase